MRGLNGIGLLQTHDPNLDAEGDGAITPSALLLNKSGWGKSEFSPSLPTAHEADFYQQNAMLISFKNSRPLWTVAFSLLTVCVLPQLSPVRALAADPAKASETPAKPTTKMPSPTNVTPTEAEALIHSHKQLLIIDVRTQEEFAEGHISGARNVNFNSPTFLERMKEFEGKSILVHCAAGGRSARALEALSNASFAEVYHLNKGFNGWIEAGKPISTK